MYSNYVHAHTFIHIHTNTPASTYLREFPYKSITLWNLSFQTQKWWWGWWRMGSEEETLSSWLGLLTYENVWLEICLGFLCIRFQCGICLYYLYSDTLRICEKYKQTQRKINICSFYSMAILWFPFSFAIYFLFMYIVQTCVGIQV